MIRSKAPLRLGLAGGGTDISPYCDEFGGMTLNATIDMYSYCSILPSENKKIKFESSDLGVFCEYDLSSKLPIDGLMDLHKGVYNRIIREFNNNIPIPIHIVTHSDAPSGSGLGSSSTMVVAIIQAFVELLGLPLGEYDVALLAYQIERQDLRLSGGKQDQYAATFGGFNFMEFYREDRVIVNPLRVKTSVRDELEASMILYYTGISRESAHIIDEQVHNTKIKNQNAISAMHEVKEDALKIKEAVLKGDILRFSKVLGKSWKAKKNMASKISNFHIESAYDIGMEAGAYSGKVSGAGGGGFMMFVVDPLKKLSIIKALNKLEGKCVNFHFVQGGARSWRV
jgi:D-glycero-alpha-D-manno-heptose-7-phosphate kinase